MNHFLGFSSFRKLYVDRLSINCFSALAQAQKEENDECKSNSSDDTSGRISRASAIREAAAKLQNHSPVPSGSSDPTARKSVVETFESSRPKSADCQMATNQAEPLDLSRKRQSSSDR